MKWKRKIREGETDSLSKMSDKINWIDKIMIGVGALLIVIIFVQATTTINDVSIFTTGNITAEGDLNITDGDNDFFVDVSTSRVGIGTASPDKKFHVQAGDLSTTAHGDTDFIFENTGTASIGLLGADFGGVYFGDAANGNAGRILYTHSIDKMTFRVNSADRMGIDSSGNVGIGDTTPEYVLDVDGNASIDGTTFVVDAVNNRVGIGTTAPANKLEVDGDINITGKIFASDGTAALPSITFGNDSDVGLSSITTNGLTISAAGVEAVRITNNLLAIVPGGSASSPSLTRLSDLNTGLFWAAADELGFTTGGTEAMRIDSSQNVGINTTSPQQKLHVIGSVNITSRAHLGNLTVEGKEIQFDGASNKQMLFFDGTNWAKVGTVPVNDGDHLSFCDSGSIQWIASGGTCPL